MTTVEPIEHPTWCDSEVCGVRYDHEGYVLGEHHGYRDRLLAIVGTEAYTGLVCENRAEPSDVYVGMWIPADAGFVYDSEQQRFDKGQRIEMYPEEARLLARHLLLAADRCDRQRAAAALMAQ